MKNDNVHIVYSQAVIEFTTVVAETCRFLENLDTAKKTGFIATALRLFSLLYLKTVLLEIPENADDRAMYQYVGRTDYDYVKQMIAQILGADDSFLDTSHPDMSYSDLPIAATVSESIADVYQEIRDYAENFQSGNELVMNEALTACLDSFCEHWGLKLLNAVRALHLLKCKKQEEGYNFS
ncbi:MAG: DUF5063 domain-containing protein [Prevotellaceae bacterium]|jgi:hypothetical protein|nr:DUF5063 domain-containing protein [Prevotellaceae bacterium]